MSGHAILKQWEGLYGRTCNAQKGVQKGSAKNPEGKKGRKEEQKETCDFRYSQFLTRELRVAEEFRRLIFPEPLLLRELLQFISIFSQGNISRFIVFFKKCKSRIRFQGCKNICRGVYSDAVLLSWAKGTAGRTGTPCPFRPLVGPEVKNAGIPRRPE